MKPVQKKALLFTMASFAILLFFQFFAAGTSFALLDGPTTPFETVAAGILFLASFLLFLPMLFFDGFLELGGLATDSLIPLFLGGLVWLGLLYFLWGWLTKRGHQ